MTAVPQANDSSDILSNAVRDKAHASLLVVGGTRTVPARLEALSHDTVTLLLYGGPLDEVPPGGAGLVQFAHADRRHSFVAAVLGTEPGDLIVLRRPVAVARAEQRRAFRVPIRRGELPVEVVGPDGPCIGHAVDVSRLGMGVRLEGVGALPGVGDSVRIKFTWSCEPMVLAARLVQTAGAHLGVEFADHPAGLDDLVAEAESRWLRRRYG